MKKAIVGNLVRFTFDPENGTTQSTLTLDCTKLSGAVRAYCVPSAMSHRLGDMAAIARKSADGSIITVTEKMRHDTVEAGIAHYESGTADWDMRVARAPAQNPTWVLIAEKRGVSYDVIAAEHAQADLDALAAL